MSNPNFPLRLNLGFIIHQGIGYSRDFPYEIPTIQFPPDLTLKDLAGNVRATRTPQGIVLQVSMHAQILMECVRCLTEHLQSLAIDFTELYAFSKRFATESGLILPEDGQIDLGPLVRETMLLEIPINPLCRPDCQGLCPVCGSNLNENQCNHQPETGDPRLSALKTLFDPN